ncbi:MAG: hypothetical protein ACQEVA_20565 [Myxococcota bacterium]
MTRFQLGVGIQLTPQSDRFWLSGDLDYRTAINDRLDYRFPLIFSLRTYEDDSVTTAIEGGLNGGGYAENLGVLLEGYALVPTQIRFSDRIGITVQARFSALTSWGDVNASYSVGGSTFFEWTNGDRLQGSFGTQLSWNQGRLVNTPGAFIVRDPPDDSLLTRVGATRTRPLLQVRIHKGFHLYESSNATFDARTFDFVAHTHVLGFNWYY